MSALRLPIPPVVRHRLSVDQLFILLPHSVQNVASEATSVPQRGQFTNEVVASALVSLVVSAIGGFAYDVLLASVSGLDDSAFETVEGVTNGCASVGACDRAIIELSASAGGVGALAPELEVEDELPELSDAAGDSHDGSDVYPGHSGALSCGSVSLFDLVSELPIYKVL